MIKEMVRFWVEKTRDQVRENEREMVIRELFYKEFNVYPQDIYYNCNHKLRAKLSLDLLNSDEEEFYIEGRKVKSIEFFVCEDPFEEICDYQFLKYNNIYKWEKVIFHDNKKYLYKIIIET